MKNKISKIQHIQETNKIVEKQYLEEQIFNKAASKLGQFGAKVSAKFDNLKHIFDRYWVDRNAKLEGAMTKFNIRNSHFSDEFQKLLNEIDDVLKVLQTVEEEITKKISEVTSKGASDIEIKKYQDLIDVTISPLNKKITKYKAAVTASKEWCDYIIKTLIKYKNPSNKEEDNQ